MSDGASVRDGAHQSQYSSQRKVECWCGSGNVNGDSIRGLGEADMPCPGDALAGESKVVALPDGIGVHLLDGDAVLHHGHSVRTKTRATFCIGCAKSRPKGYVVDINSEETEVRMLNFTPPRL